MDATKYTDKVRAIPYPDKPDKPIHLPWNASLEDRRKYADEVEAYLPMWQEFLKKMKDYRKEVDEVEAEFKSELLEELDVTKNKKADLLFAIAWQKGHSSGYSEVWNEACDIVDLIK